MEQIRNVLTWNVSARDPVVLFILLAAIVLLAFFLSGRPRYYLPLILITSALPKLFTITQYESFGNNQTAAGFSVADIVFAAGIGALLLRRRRRSLTPEAAAFGNALTLWTISILFSIGVGLVLWPGTYKFGNALYALRYIMAIASYALGARYAMGERDERSMRKLLSRLAFAGNITIALGVLYYFSVGGSGGGYGGSSGSDANVLFNADSTVFRSYLFFYDYAIDMGYFAVTIAILNLILISDKRNTLLLRWNYCIGIGLCVAAVLLLGERVNVLVMAASLGYFLWETAKSAHRSVRVSVIFQMACLLAVVGAGSGIMRVVAPTQITKKFDAVIQNDYSADAAVAMGQAGVPQGVIAVVSTLPIGDFAIRLALAVASLWFFFQHPLGVGFWGQLSVVGWYAHHEIVTILVEQGIPGLAAFVWLVVMLRRLLWAHRDLSGSAGHLGVLLRAVTVGLFVALIGANTVLLDMKFATVYWTLVGVWSVLPRTRTPAPVSVAALESEFVDRREVVSA